MKKTQSNLRLPVLALLALAGLLVFHPPVSALTVTVGPSAGTPGSACEFSTPQAAIDSLRGVAGNHFIRVEAGLYAGPDAAVDIDDQRIDLSADFSAGSQCSEINGDQLARLVASDTGLEGGRTVLVRNGARAVFTRFEISANQRGGIQVQNAFLFLGQSLVSANRTPPGVGGAGVLIQNSETKFIASTFEVNQSGANGGAIACQPGPGTAFSTIKVDNTSFIENSALSGGGVHLAGGCTLQIDGEVVFDGNASTLDGGAIAALGQPSTPNVIIFRSPGSPRVNHFLNNRSGRDGGAINVGAETVLTERAPAQTRFVGNLASRSGGALYVEGNNAQVNIRNAQFIDNSSDKTGGAIAVVDGDATLRADCANGDAEDYCARFKGNTVTAISAGSKKGGSVYVDGNSRLNIDGYAFSDSLNPASINLGAGGSIAAIDDGFFELSNSLVFDNPLGLPAFTHQFQLNGGSSLFSFNTMVDAPRVASVVNVRPGAAASFVGNIIAFNRAGVVGDGDISGVCNNAQLGTNPAPQDPRFETTSAGRYRLAANSPMIDGALSCIASSLPDGYVFPEKDLDRQLRLRDGEGPRQIDLGAFEFGPRGDAVFANGFDDDPA